MKKSFQYMGDNYTFQKRMDPNYLIRAVDYILLYMVNSMAFLFGALTFQCRVSLTDLFVTFHQSFASLLAWILLR